MTRTKWCIGCFGENFEAELFQKSGQMLPKQRILPNIWLLGQLIKGLLHNNARNLLFPNELTKELKIKQGTNSGTKISQELIRLLKPFSEILSYEHCFWVPFANAVQRPSNAIVLVTPNFFFVEAAADLKIGNCSKSSS